MWLVEHWSRLLHATAMTPSQEALRRGWASSYGVGWGLILLGWGQPSSAPDFRSHFPSFCIYGSGAQCCDYGVHIHDFIHLVLKRKRCILDCLYVQYYIWINRILLGGGWDWICHWAFSTSIIFNTARRLQTGLEERKGHLCAGWTTFIQDKMRVLVLEAGNCYLLLNYCKEQTEVLQNLRTGSPAGQQNTSSKVNIDTRC